MKFGEIFRFELAYQIRRFTTWLCFGALFAFGVLMTAGFEPNDDVFVNAPFMIAFDTVFGGAIWLLMAASVAGEAAARDVQTRMHPLTYTTPVSKAAYLGGRLLAAFVLNALMLLAVPAAKLLTLLLFDFDASLVGPFRPAAYLTAYGFIALPNAFVVTAIQFSWATLSRRPITSYLASGLILITSHFGVMIVAEQLFGQWELVRVLDLIGFGGIIVGLGDTWTSVEQNTRLILLEGPLLANRLIWLGVALGVLAFTHLRFRLAHPAESSRRSSAARRGKVQASTPATTVIARSTPIVVLHARQTFGLATSARQTLAIAWTSFGAIAKSRAGLMLVALFALHLVVLMPEYMEQFGIPLFPRTERIVGLLTAPVNNLRTPLVIIPLLIAYYAGGLVWRERDAGVSDIADAAPVSDWVLFLGKLGGLGLMVVAGLGLLATAGMLAQLTMGYHNLEVGLYLKVLFGLQLPEYLLWACLTLVVHALVNQKYLGHMVILFALGFIGFAPTFGIQHNLLIYGASPGWSYTDMRGFGASLGPWLWFKLYWAAWALLLAVVARLLWSRGREGRLAARLRLARARFTLPTMRAAAAAVGLILILGGFVFYNTNVLNEYQTGADSAEEAAEYERRYGRYEGIPQPMLTGTNLRVEIYPDRREAEIRGTYRLVNRSAVPIRSIHVATVPEVRTGDVTFDLPAARVLADEELGHRIYALEQPLAPGDALTLSFEVTYESRGFRNNGIDAPVVANSTVFNNSDWLPAIGYQPHRELRDLGDRRDYRLVGLPSFPGSLYDAEARRYVAGQELIEFEAVVGTDDDQVAIAPGALRQTWTEGSRRYFHYAADAPIRNEYAFYSARYAVHEARWNDPSANSGQAVAIEIFHDPRHTEGLDRMVRSIQASLSRFTAEFGPYPYRHIRFIERAGGDGGMSADASSVAYDEPFTHFNPRNPSRGLDLPFYVVAHEVAHQWWGTRLAPAVVEGLWLMSESLAVYSGMQVLEETYGQDQVRRYLDFVRTIYAIPRTRAAVPLLRANESFLGYRKGAVALYALSRYIGEDQVNTALRRLIDKHATGVPPLPTSLDLYRELREVTPDSLHYLLHDLFEANTFWELETERATAVQTAAGTWQVTLDVKARKVVVDEAGAETDVPMNDWVEIGVFAPAEEDDVVLSKPLYVEKHRVRSGRQTITVTVAAEPAGVGIDPSYLLIDLDTDDNIAQVTVTE